MRYKTIAYCLIAFSIGVKIIIDFFVDPSSELYINVSKLALIPIFGAFAIILHVFFKYPDNPTLSLFRKKH